MDPDLAPEDDLAARMRTVADLFVETARTFGVTFNYSKSGVIALEEWMDRLWDPDGPDPTDAELQSNTKLVGAYFGEVVIRTVMGRWVWSGSPGQPAVRLRPRVDALVLNKAYKRQVNGPSDSLVDFYREIRRQVMS